MSKSQLGVPLTAQLKPESSSMQRREDATKQHPSLGSGGFDVKTISALRRRGLLVIKGVPPTGNSKRPQQASVPQVRPRD